jgi:hypothetical protein
MTRLMPLHAEVLRQQDFEATELRALKSSRRGKVRLFLEVNASRLAALFDADDDDGGFYRCSEFASEAELFSAYDRAAAALAR